MASTDTKPTAHTRILHINKNSQTNTCRPTDYFGMRRPDRKNFGIYGQTPTAYYSIAEIAHKDTTDFINFILRKQKVPNTLLVTMNVTSLYTKIHQLYAQHIRRILSKQPSNPNYVYQTYVEAHSTRKLVQAYKQTFSATLRDRDWN